jgi:hypothetical protein
MLPRQLLDYIGAKEVEAYEEHCAEALLVTNVHKVRKQIFRNLCRGGRRSSDDCVLVELVCFGERNRLFPTRVLLVQMRREPSEFKQFLCLQYLGKPDAIEVIETVNRIPQRLVVFFLNE